jgi:tRNA pseudouridine32 synthase/23S rRNA pseudouridine746 synthase
MFNVLFEDGDLIVVDKPEGLATIAESEPTRPSLREELERTSGEKLYVVHRIDKAASGATIFAKHADAHRYLNNLFSERKILKQYLALSHGLIPQDHGTIDSPMREYGSGRMGVDVERGKPSKTVFVVLKRYQVQTLLDVNLITGRRHQIRVHLYSIGHPIVGDLRYGDKARQSTYPRLMLHARGISFPLPSGEEVAVEAPVPVSFQTILDGLQMGRVPPAQLSRK